MGQNHDDMSSGIWRMRPPYGNVLQLCAELGYGSKDKDDPRYYNKLKMKILNHRKYFIDKAMAQDTEFPLNYDHVQVQECVTGFLTLYYYMFSEGHEGFIGPVMFPSIHDRLVNFLDMEIAGLTFLLV